MANGFIYIRDTEKTSVTLGGSSVIVNKLNLPFGIKTPFLPKIPVIDIGTYYDTVDNPCEITTPMLLDTYDPDNDRYDAILNGLNYGVIFATINEEETEFGMVIMTK